MSKLKITDKIGQINAVKRVALETMAQNAIYQFKVVNFEAQGFVDNSLQPWAPRKTGSKRDHGRKILVDTGRMRNSITVLSRNANSVTVGTNVPYAEFHNEGTNKLPKREFIGPSKKLYDKNQAVLDQYLSKLR